MRVRIERGDYEGAQAQLAVPGNTLVRSASCVLARALRGADPEGGAWVIGSETAGIEGEEAWIGLSAEALRLRRHFDAWPYSTPTVELEAFA